MKRRTAKNGKKNLLLSFKKMRCFIKKHIFLGKKLGFLLFSRISIFCSLKLLGMVQLPIAETILLNVEI